MPYPKSKFIAERTSRLTNKWWAVRWPIYAFALAVAIVGVVLLRVTAEQSETQGDKVQNNFDVVVGSIDRLVANVAAILKKLDKLKPEEIRDQIDETCAEDLRDFADARSSMIRKQDLTFYAEVMTQFASGERFVNRAWSAATDGYVHEAQKSLERAGRHFTAAQKTDRRRLPSNNLIAKVFNLFAAGTDLCHRFRFQCPGAVPPNSSSLVCRTLRF